MKKSMAVLAALLCAALALGACNGAATDQNSNDTAAEQESDDTATEQPDGDAAAEQDGDNEDEDTEQDGDDAAAPVWADYSVLPQFQEPAADAPVAVIKTAMGEIQAVLFPEIAPLAVENFITHAENGYYDGLIFHRVIEDFMIQTGDPTGTGNGGESIWGEGFKDEFHPLYHHFKGALSMAKANHDENGSQFFIVQAGPLDEEYADYVEAISVAAAEEEYLNRSTGEMDSVSVFLSPEVVTAYREVGGSPHLDYLLQEYQHSVFGQVLRGIEVVDEIAVVETDENDRPLEEVIVESITITTYGEIQ